MKRKTPFILVCGLAIAILGIQVAKGDNEEGSSVENNEGHDKKNKGEDGEESSEEKKDLAININKKNKKMDEMDEMALLGQNNQGYFGFYFKYDKILKCKYDKDMANVKPNREEQNEEECENPLDLQTEKLFKDMDDLHGQFDSVLTKYHAAAEKLDEVMLQAFLKSRGVGERALHQAGGNTLHVPAGLQVGSYLVLSDDVSLYFVHRMKVRNSTIFRVVSLQNNFNDMQLYMVLELNDLRITGSYEQLHGDETHHAFSYKPTFGEIDIVFSKVMYGVTGYYRLVQNRLYVENIIINHFYEEDMIVHLGNAGNDPVKISTPSIRMIVRRIKSHFEHWLKDYFNDYFMFVDGAGKNLNAELQKYDQKKTMVLNGWMDQAITLLKAKMRHTDSTALHLKVFPMKIFAPDGMIIDVGPMVLRGIDSLHRRSFTSFEEFDDYSIVMATLGFGQLKVEGNYTILIRSGHKRLEATFEITLDGFTAHLVILPKRGKKVPHNMYMTLVGPTRTEFTTVEGSSTRYLAAYKHILETYLIPIASDRTMDLIEILGAYKYCHTFEDYWQIRHIDLGQILEGGKGSQESAGADEGGLPYAIKRKDSIEVEVPGKKGMPPKKLHINFNEKLNIDNAKRQKRRKNLH